MSAVVQPETFAFTAENAAAAEAIIKKYPAGRQRSAVIPLLDLAQRQNGGWLPRAAVRHVAEMLDMAEIRAWEVATFYTMFNLEPHGRACIEVCTTTPCWLRGSDAVVAALEDELGIKVGGVTADGAIGLREVECLGACVHAPMLQIGDDYYEDLSPQNARAIARDLRLGQTPKPGSRIGRPGAAPASGPKVLTGKKA
ncbi:MAG: NADH-quinone oxidoreductase subunit NuoE [Alphaproteobacteria bacterium]